MNEARVLLTSLRDKIRSDGSSLVAAGVAFYGALATIPGLILLVSFYGIFTDTAQAERHVDLLLDVLPATTVRALEAQIHPLADFSHFHLSLGLLVSVAAILWTVSNAARAIVRAVVIAYGQAGRKSRFEARLVSIGVALGFIVLGTLALGLIAAIPAWLTVFDPDHALVNFANLRWGLIAAVAVVGTTALYRLAPPDRPPTWRAVLPGSLIATALWLAVSLGFSLYVSNVARYNATYGGLASGAVLLLWFWLTAAIIILGAQLNFVREKWLSAVGVGNGEGDEQEQEPEADDHQPGHDHAEDLPGPS